MGLSLQVFISAYVYKKRLNMIGFFDNDISSFAVVGKLDDCSYYEMKKINSMPIYF